MFKKDDSNKVVILAAVSVMLIGLAALFGPDFDNTKDITLGAYEPETVHVEYFEDIPIETEEITIEFETETEEAEEELVVIPYISDEELDLLARCVMSEAGNQEELGKRLVIDVILNRVDCEAFAGQNTIADVIFAKGQFEVVSKGTIYKYIPTDDIYELIREELVERTNSEVVYFRTGKYHNVGTPWQKVGDHYFSTL